MGPSLSGFKRKCASLNKSITLESRLAQQQQENLQVLIVGNFKLSSFSTWVYLFEQQSVRILLIHQNKYPSFQCNILNLLSFHNAYRGDLSIEGYMEKASELDCDTLPKHGYVRFSWQGRSSPRWSYIHAHHSRQYPDEQPPSPAG